jgi:hypothetical protein
MKRIVTTLALTATMVVATASVALAGGPNCAGIDTGGHTLVNHGDHITGDYVEPGVDGPANGVRGRAAHFGAPTPTKPGASFCQTHGDNNAKPLPARP